MEVVRKQIPLVPQLAQKLLNLKDQLDKERTSVKQLSAQLENPSNHPN